MSALARVLLVALLAILAPAANAAISCTTITSAGGYISYVSNTTASVQATFTISCNRSATTDSTTQGYKVTVDNGLNGSGPGGNQNNAANGTAKLKYELYTDSACSTVWQKTTTIAGTVDWGSSLNLGTITQQQSFWICITAKQAPANSGTYTDTVTMTATNNGGAKFNVNGSIPVTFYAPALCTVTQAPSPSTLTLAYAAFQATPSSGTSTFKVQCTNGMPYTMSLDASENVLVGIRYLLSLSGTSANGSGTPQTYTVTVSAPSGQAGTCSTGTCSGTHTHTITIAY